MEYIMHYKDIIHKHNNLCWYVAIMTQSYFTGTEQIATTISLYKLRNWTIKYQDRLFQ